MADAFIVRRGGGGGAGKLFAVIQATYPVGSICTATNGTKTLKAKDTSGLALFAIPEPKTLPETWTVTATDGTNTKYESVEITSEGQSVSVTLSYAVILYQTGTDYLAASGGWATKDDATVKANSNKLYVASDVGTGPNEYLDGFVYAKKLVNLTGIDTITAVCTEGNFVYGDHELVVLNSSIDVVASKKISKKGTYTLSVLSLTGNYYVGFKTTGYASYDAACDTNASYSSVICK